MIDGRPAVLLPHARRQPALPAETCIYERVADGCDGAQRSDAGAAQEIEWERARNERPVQDVNGVGAARDIGAALCLVALEHGIAARIIAARVGRADDLCEVGDVAQAKIQALGADRRENVRGLADERDAPREDRPRRSRPTAGKRVRVVL